MNNKGFGMSEVLLFIGVSMFTLVAVTIYYRSKLENFDSYNIDENIEYAQDINELKPNNIDVSEKYIDLENRLLNASKDYYFDKKEDTIISLKKLQQLNLIGELIDPNNGVKCDGYVIYNSSNDEYNPYIYCDGMYSTKAFNSDLIEK